MRKPKLLGRVGMVALASIAGLSAATVAAVIQSGTAFAASPTTTVTYQGTDTATQYEGYAVTIGSFPAGTFSNNASLSVVECAGTTAAPPADASACDGITSASFTAASNGSFAGGAYSIYLLGVAGYAFHNSGGVVVDASGSHPGVLYIGEDLTNFAANKGFADFTIGRYGRLVPQTATPSVSATSTVTSGGASASLNASTNVPAIDSAQNAMTVTGYTLATPPSATNGTAACASPPTCTYTPNATFTAGNPAQDFFGVTATATETVGGAPVNIPIVTETVNLNHPVAPTVNPTPTNINLTADTANTTGTANPQAAGVDSGGNPEPITSVTAAGATLGTVSCPGPAPFTCTYTLTANQPAGATDSFTVTALADGLNSTSKTVNVSIPASFPPACDVTNAPTCGLNQIVNIPVTAGDLTMGQNSGLPVDTLGSTLTSAGACSSPPVPLTLNGQPQYACGDMAPITVVNARGTDAGWTLSGQVTDFLDSGKVNPSTLTPVGASPIGALNSSCDTTATFNNHCIPGNNAGWVPAASVAQNIVPGDVAQINAGANKSAPGLALPATASGILAGSCGTYTAGAGASTLNAGTYYVTPDSKTAPAVAACSVQPTSASYPNDPAPVAGLHSAAQTLCLTASGHSGGTFVCGAELIVAVPASAFAPVATSGYAAVPGYQAFLTLTLA